MEPLQGILALVFAVRLVALTGGLSSPFIFAFPLIVGAGALLVAPRIALALAVLATAAYLAAGFGSTAPRPGDRVATMAVNLTGLNLLAYIGAGRSGASSAPRARAAIRLSTIDSLTGLYNRTYFFAALEREIARGDRSGRAFCLLMLDLDDLKAVNDRFGHFAGDQVLRGVAEVIAAASARSTPRRATAATSSSRSCPRPTRPAPGCWPRRSGSVVDEQGMPAVDPAPDGLGRRGLVPGRRPLGRRAPRERGPGDVRLEARRQEPGDRRVHGPDDRGRTSRRCRARASAQAGIASPKARLRCSIAER